MVPHVPYCRVVFMGCHEDLLGTDKFHPAWHFDTNTKVFRFFDPPSEKKRKSPSFSNSTSELSSSINESQPSMYSPFEPPKCTGGENSRTTHEGSRRRFSSGCGDPEIPFGKREVIDSASDSGNVADSSSDSGSVADSSSDSGSVVDENRANAREGEGSSSSSQVGGIYRCDSTGNRLRFSWDPPKLLVVLHGAKLAAWNLFKEHHYMTSALNGNSKVCSSDISYYEYIFCHTLIEGVHLA